MIEPQQLFWLFGIVVMVLALVALWEIQRSYFRREHEVMFGTPLFDRLVKEQGLLPEEVKVLEKLVRSSRYENKDAILNTATISRVKKTFNRMYLRLLVHFGKN